MLHTDKVQESVVLRYLASVGSRLEELDEDRVMPLVRQHELMPLVASHLTQYHGSLESLEAGCLFLSAAIDTEAYMTSRAAYLPAESIALLKDFNKLFLNRIAATAEKKKALRPLLDAVMRAA